MWMCATIDGMYILRTYGATNTTGGSRGNYIVWESIWWTQMKKLGVCSFLIINVISNLLGVWLDSVIPAAKS